MRKVSTLFFLSLAVLAIGMNIFAFIKLKHVRNGERLTKDQLEETDAQIDEYQRIRQVANDCRKRNDELNSAIHSLVESYYLHDLPLPADTFTSDYQPGFYSSSGVDRFRLYVWIPPGKSIEFFVDYGDERLPEGEKQPDSEYTYLKKTAGWHSIECRVKEGETRDVMIMQFNGKQILQANLESRVNSKIVEQGSLHYGNIWSVETPKGNQIGNKSFDTITWKVATKDENGKKNHHWFRINVQESD